MALRFTGTYSGVQYFTYYAINLPRMDNMQVADLDGDGDDDLLALGGSFPGSEENIGRAGYVLWNEPEGYRVEALAGHASVAARDFEFADFDGDGRLDIFISTHGYDDEVAAGERNFLYLQRNGSFVAAGDRLPDIVDFAHGSGHGDIDGDGDIDILVNAQYGNNPTGPYFLINDGTGHFSLSRDEIPESAIGVPTFEHERFHWVSLADVNGDGLADMISGKERPFFNSSADRLFINQGGRFTDSGSSLLPAHPDFGDNFVVVDILDADWDGDGDLDLAVLSQQAEPYGLGWGLQLLENDGAGRFTDVTRAAIDGPASNPDGAWMVYIGADDLNADGYLDLVVRSFSGGTVAPDTPVAWLGDGRGGFSPLLGSDVLAADDSYLLGYSTLIRDTDGLKLVRLAAGDDQIQVAELTATALPRITIETGAGNDRIVDVPGGETIEGHGGRDTYVVGVDRASALIAERDGAIAVTHDGETDRLASFERIEFDDGTLAFDLASNAGQAYRVYQAAFDRTPDLVGLSYWIKAMDSGISLDAVAAGFVRAPEFMEVYGPDISNEDYIAELYRNVLGRDGEAAGITFWRQQMEDGLDQARVLALFSESPENVAAVHPAIAEGIWFV